MGRPVERTFAARALPSKAATLLAATLRVGVGIYLAGLAVWAILRLTPVARFGPFELVDIFGVWLYGAALGVAVLACVVSPRRGWPSLVVALVLFGSQYGALFAPRLGSSPPGPALRVMTANLVWTDADAAGFAAAVAREQPDLVAVQELGVRMAGPLAAALGPQYPYQALAASAQPDGVGLFSRIVFESVEPADIGPRPGPCVCQSVTLRVQNQLVEILNAHPWAPDIGFRRVFGVQLPVHFEDEADEPGRRKLIDRLDERTLPLVLAGDLNTSDRQPYYRELRGRLGDAHLEAGWGLGWTFPSAPVGAAPIPLVRIDYVLHSPEWQARSERTGYFASSDHRYVVADLVLTAGR